MSRSSASVKIVMASTLLCGLFAAAPLWAQEIVNWTNPGADTYNEATNWDAGFIPGVTNRFDINNGGTILVGAADPVWSVDRFVMGNISGGGGIGFLEIDGGTLNNSGSPSVGSLQGGTGTVTVTAGTLQSDSHLDIGRAGTGYLNVSGGQVNLGGNLIVGDRAIAPGSGYGAVTHSGGSVNATVINVGREYDSSNPTESGLYTLSGTAQASAARMYVGGGGGVGRVEMSGGSLDITGTFLRVGEGATGYGEFNMTGGNLSVGTQLLIGHDNGTGVFNMSGGTVTANSSLFVGSDPGGVGEFNLSDGTVNTDGFIVGANGSNGKLTMTGGALNAAGFFALGHPDSSVPDNVGEIDQSGGVLTAQQVVRIGRTSGREGVYTISGDAEANFESGVDVGHVNGSLGTLSLNGGTVTTPYVGSAAAAARSVVYFNGGVLRASQDNTEFMGGLIGDPGEEIAGATILAGGAIIDNNGFEITIAQDLIGEGNDGGLVSRGSGTLTLSGTGNSYTGNTVIEAGTLVVENPFFDELSTISLAAGAFLDLNFIGTNQVYGLIVDGVSQDVGLYSAGNTTYLSGDGSLNVIPKPSTIALLIGLLPLLIRAYKRRR